MHDDKLRTPVRKRQPSDILPEVLGPKSPSNNPLPSRHIRPLDRRSVRGWTNLLGVIQSNAEANLLTTYARALSYPPTRTCNLLEAHRNAISDREPVKQDHTKSQEHHDDDYQVHNVGVDGKGFGCAGSAPEGPAVTSLIKRNINTGCAASDPAQLCPARRAELILRNIRISSKNLGNTRNILSSSSYLKLVMRFFTSVSTFVRLACDNA